MSWATTFRTTAAAEWAEAMGIDWMTGRELAQARVTTATEWEAGDVVSELVGKWTDLIDGLTEDFVERGREVGFAQRPPAPASTFSTSIEAPRSEVLHSKEQQP